MLAPVQKPRECRKCGKAFMAMRSTQAVCSTRCATGEQVAKRKADAALEKAQHKAKKLAMKTIPRLIKEAQASFNAWVRERDRGKPCICCGKPLVLAAEGIRAHRVDAGHYRSTGSAPHLRFNEANCHAQDVQCNRYGAGRAVDYRIGLIARIGLAAVEGIESNNEVHKWTREELIAIKAMYDRRHKELKKRRETT